MLNRTVWHVALWLDWIQKEKCSCRPASVLTWRHIYVLLPVCACTCACHVLCSVGVAGVIRASSPSGFTGAFESVRLLFPLSAARCYNPWPRPAKSVSLSSRSIVVGLCVSVAKQQLACSHTEVCVMRSCRGQQLSQTHTLKELYTSTYIKHVSTRDANLKWIPQPV